MILLPTRNRPHNLKRFMDSYHATGATEPVLVILDQDDAVKYDDIILPVGLPSHWPFPFINTSNRDLREAMNAPLKRYPNETYYAIMADDVVPLTPQWDKYLSKAAGAHNVAWCDDGIHADRLCTHPFIGGDLIRAWGHFISPMVKRGSADLIWMSFAKALGVDRYVEEAKFIHLHWQVGKGEFDSTYALQPSHTEDGAAYREYVQSPQFLTDVMQVKEKLGI